MKKWCEHLKTQNNYAITLKTCLVSGPWACFLCHIFAGFTSLPKIRHWGITTWSKVKRKRIRWNLFRWNFKHLKLYRLSKQVNQNNKVWASNKLCTIYSESSISMKYTVNVWIPNWFGTQTAGFSSILRQFGFQTLSEIWTRKSQTKRGLHL